MADTAKHHFEFVNLATPKLNELRQRIDGVDLRVTREYLGLTTAWLSEYLGVAERSVHRWESGERPIPTGVRAGIEHLEAATAAFVEEALAALRDAKDSTLVTYRTDSDYRQHQPDAGPDSTDGTSRTPWPASWHRAVCARVARQVPGGVELRYWSS